MSHPLLSILLYLTEAAKENQTGPVVCHWCNNRVNIIKYGKYQRYGFAGNERIDIQRYLCKHDQCRRTFSILPHPFLRITRFSLCMFNALIKLLDQQHSAAQIARSLDLSWSTIVLAIEKGRSIMHWLAQEAKTEPVWAPTPCINPSRTWSEFIRMFAMKFYPKRYATAGPTEYQYVK